MAQLDRTLTKGARRIAIARFVTALTFTLAIAAGAMCVWRIAEKGFMVPAPDWLSAWGIALGAALLGAVAWVWVTRPDREAVARALDESLGLKATLATAAWARQGEGDDTDAWRSATIDEGERAAKRADVRSAVPVALPRYWAAPAALALVAVAGGWIPQQDVLALFDKEQRDKQLADAEREKEIIEIQQAIEDSRDDLDAALSGVDDDALNELLEEKD
ncbi:MAG: hypothetical protein AAGH64_11870, partial [Planctomycetota bacterium]